LLTNIGLIDVDIEFDDGLIVATINAFLDFLFVHELILVGLMVLSLHNKGAISMLVGFYV